MLKERINDMSSFGHYGDSSGIDSEEGIKKRAEDVLKKLNKQSSEVSDMMKFVKKNDELVVNFGEEGAPETPPIPSSVKILRSGWFDCYIVIEEDPEVRDYHMEARLLTPHQIEKVYGIKDINKFFV